MLKGSRDAVVHKIQPISIHGQLSYDVHYEFADEPDSPHVARIGPEDEGPLGFLEAFWQSLMRTLDAGTMGGSESRETSTLAPTQDP